MRGIALPMGLFTSMLEVPSERVPLETNGGRYHPGVRSSFSAMTGAMSTQ